MASVMEPGTLIVCPGAQLYVVLGEPIVSAYAYSTEDCDLAMQLDVGPSGDTLPSFWPIRFRLTEDGDSVLWWP